MVKYIFFNFFYITSMYNTYVYLYNENSYSYKIVYKRTTKIYVCICIYKVLSYDLVASCSCNHLCPFILAMFIGYCVNAIYNKPNTLCKHKYIYTNIHMNMSTKICMYWCYTLVNTYTTNT